MSFVLEAFLLYFLFEIISFGIMMDFSLALLAPTVSS